MAFPNDLLPAAATWFRNRLVTAVAIQANITDPLNTLAALTAVGNLTPIPLAAGAASNAYTPRYLLIGGVVYFFGDVKQTNGNAYAPGGNYNIAAAGGLPTGVRPATSPRGCAGVSSAGNSGRFQFNTDGSIVLVNGPTSTSNMSLDGISYVVAA